MLKKLSILLIIVLLTACGASPTAAPSQTETETEPQAELQPVQLGVGFVPNVQFAPFYVAQAKGFYVEEGLDVTLEYGYEDDFVKLTATGERQFAIASGDQVILGRAQELPIVYIMKWYEQFPVALIAHNPEDAPVTQIEDVTGTIGIPGPFGASYIGWQALLYATELDESSIQLESIGFTQTEALSIGQVDAAMGYVANEPIRLEMAGVPVAVFQVSDYINLISNGIVTNETLIQENPDLVRRLVQGSLRGLAYTLENPQEAFEISRTFIPEMTDEDAPAQQAVLDASLPLWESATLGQSSEQAWVESFTFMQSMALVDAEAELTVEAMFTNQFVETSAQ